MKKWYSQQEAMGVLNQIFRDHDYQELEQQMKQLVLEKIPLPKAPYQLEIRKEEPNQQKKPKIILKKKEQRNDLEPRSNIEMKREAFREAIRQEDLEKTFASKRKFVISSSNSDNPNLQEEIPIPITQEKIQDLEDKEVLEKVEPLEIKEQIKEVIEDAPDSIIRPVRRRKSQKRQRK